MLINQAKSIFNRAVESVRPKNLFSDKLIFRNNELFVKDHSFNLNTFNNIFVIGAGKASAYMAKSLENLLGDRITSGSVTVKYGHSVPCKKIKIKEAGHPIPDKKSISATHSIIKLLKNTDENDLVIVLLSGGGSALMEALPQDVHLSDLRALNDSLISCGADIKEINIVRKHISQIKGGQLAKNIYPSTCLSLIISDVPGDELQSIASGPTVPDSSTFADSMKIIEKYNLLQDITPAIIDYMNSGLKGEVSETLKAGNSDWNKVYNIIIGNNALALYAAKEKAESYGFNVSLIDYDMHGEGRDMATKISKILKKLPVSGKSQCLLFGGETTVTIKGNGMGGRNQEMALAALIELKNFNKPFVLLSCGTDGTDGPTDATGAVIHEGMWQLAEDKKLDPINYLKNNDSYHFFEKIDGLVKTGPTETNVMDIVIVLLK